MKTWLVAAALLLVAGPAAADVYPTLSDATIFPRAQKDVQAISTVAELDALTETVATCSAASFGQKMQHFECERAVKRYWTHYNRGRALDNYVSAIGSLFEGFDNVGATPTDAMATAYKSAATNMIALMHDLNARYGQLEKH